MCAGTWAQVVGRAGDSAWGRAGVRSVRWSGYIDGVAGWFITLPVNYPM
jgi:hypothetical protein